jgi:integral membrane protein
MIDHNYLNSLRLLGKIEGTSTLILFLVAMPLKYLAAMPIAVTIVGSIHGMLFLALIWKFFNAIDRVPIPRSLAIHGVVAAVIPFGPFILDSRLARIGEATATHR